MKKIIFTFVVTAFTVMLQSCFLLEGMVKPSENPATAPKKEQRLAVGDTVNGKTIVWENTNGGGWKFLAMGMPSDTMPWDLDTSKYFSSQGISSDIGRGKANSIILKREFESNGSKLHTEYDCAVMYCISKGGWLPSRDEAEKVAQFTDKDFWTSNYSADSIAFYYSPMQKSLQSKFRNDRKSVVTIPIFYLDSKGNVVEPY